MAPWPSGSGGELQPRIDDSSILSGVLVFCGDCSAMVSTRDCGPRNTGSSPVSHPDGGMAQAGRRARSRISLLRVRVPLPPCDSVAQLERAPGRDPDGWQFESARYHCQTAGLASNNTPCQYRLTAERECEDLEMMVRLHLLAFTWPDRLWCGSVAQRQRECLLSTGLQVQILSLPVRRCSSEGRALANVHFARGYPSRPVKFGCVKGTHG